MKNKIFILIIILVLIAVYIYQKRSDRLNNEYVLIQKNKLVDGFGRIGHIYPTLSECNKAIQKYNKIGMDETRTCITNYNYINNY